MTDDDKEFIRTTMSEKCLLGIGLVLWDPGFHPEATRIFSVLAETLTGNMQYAAQGLAGWKVSQ